MRIIGIEYPARGQMAFCELGEPGKLRATEILIRTHYSAITNGTERHALLGEHGWQHFPGRHGYQHVGRVEAVGGEVKGFQPGDRVFYGQYVGHRSWHIVDVAHADPRSNGSHLCCLLPDDVDYAHCALLGVAGVAMRGARRCRIGAAQNVWVAGAGLIGQFAAQAARALGARVTITDVNSDRLAIARELSVHRAIHMGDEASLDALKEGGPYDCIVDAAGVETFFQDVASAGLLARGGVIGALAVRSRTTFPWGMLHGTEASIEVSCHFSLDDLRVVLHFLRQGILRIRPLVSHHVPIEQAPAVYEILRDRPADLLGVIFDWTE